MPRQWWLFVLRGILAAIFGVAAFLWPGMTFAVLVLLFGACAFVDGVLLLSFGLLAAGEGETWWPLVLGGIVGIIVRVFTVARPVEMALALIYVIAIWAIPTGLLEVVAAIRLGGIITNEWLLGLGGALSVVFGVLVLAQPVAGALAIVYLFGFYAILAGVAQIVFGMRLHGLVEAANQRVPPPANARRPHDQRLPLVWWPRPAGASASSRWDMLMNGTPRLAPRRRWPIRPSWPRAVHP